MISGEMLIELRNSWFSAKIILVMRIFVYKKGRVDFLKESNSMSYIDFRKTPNVFIIRYS